MGSPRAAPAFPGLTSGLTCLARGTLSHILRMWDGGRFTAAVPSCGLIRGVRRGVTRTYTGQKFPSVGLVRTPGRNAGVVPGTAVQRYPCRSSQRRAALNAEMLSARRGSRLEPISAQMRARGRQAVIVRQSACRAKIRASSCTARRASARSSPSAGSAPSAARYARWDRARRHPLGTARAIWVREGPGDTPTAGVRLPGPGLACTLAPELVGLAGLLGGSGCEIRWILRM
jgi:hypothetical protein